MESSKPQKSTPWSVNEVQTFLSLLAEDRIQKELDGSTRNEKVYKEIAQLLLTHGYHRTHEQCRDKIKKMKCDHRAIKDHNGRSGVNRKTWRWYAEMDAIYGHRPANNGRDCGLDSSTSRMGDNESFVASEASNDPPRSLSPMPPEPAAASTPGDAFPSMASDTSSSAQRMVTGKRKRGLFQTETVEVMRQIQAEDVVQEELNRTQQLQLVRESQELEATLRREENAQAAAFNQSFLNLLGQLVEAMSGRRN